MEDKSEQYSLRKYQVVSAAKELAQFSSQKKKEKEK